MRSDWLIYLVIGVGLLILFVCLVTKRPNNEGFQTNLQSIDPDLITKQLEQYFQKANGQYVVETDGMTRKVTEAVLVTSKFYSYPDIDYIKQYIFNTYFPDPNCAGGYKFPNALKPNKYTGELEVDSNSYQMIDGVCNKIKIEYSDQYIGILEDILYGPKKGDGSQQRNADAGLLTQVGSYTGNNMAPAFLVAKRDYAADALDYNQKMMTLYDEMMKMGAINFIHDYEDDCKKFMYVLGTRLNVLTAAVAYREWKRAEALTTQSSGFAQFIMTIMMNRQRDIYNALRNEPGVNASEVDTLVREIGEGKYWFLPHILKSGPITNRTIDTTPFTTNIYYHGDFGTVGLKDIQDSYKLCRRIYLGNPEMIPSYIYVDFNSFKAYVRNETTRELCVDPIREYVDKYGKSRRAVKDVVEFSAANCSVEITPALLALLPFHARAFVKQYIRNRRRLYIEIRRGLIGNEDYLEAYQIFTAEENQTATAVNAILSNETKYKTMLFKVNEQGSFPLNDQGKEILERTQLPTSEVRGQMIQDGVSSQSIDYFFLKYGITDAGTTASLDVRKNFIRVAPVMGTYNGIQYPTWPTGFQPYGRDSEGNLKVPIPDGTPSDRLYATGFDYYNALKSATAPPQYDLRKLPTLDIVEEKYGINVGNKFFLDSLAQNFYELTDGSYTMTYIYDVFQIGSSIFDVRFDLRKHNKPNAEATASKTGAVADINAVPLQKQIDDIKAKYHDLLESNLDAATIASARSDYLSKLSELQEKVSKDMDLPIRGATARFCIVKEGIAFKITAVTFDRRAVASFRPELNCGFDVAIGGAPGTINYTPVVKFTKNRTETINCSDTESLKRIMLDYEEAAVTDLSGAFKQGKTPGDTWDLSGSLTVTEILGAQQLNPYQCAIKWNETIFDPTTNKPLKTSLRRARISYAKNTEDWYANETVFDPSGFAWLPTDSNTNRCQFDQEEYLKLYNAGNRLGITESMTEAEKTKLILRDVSENAIRQRMSVCPRVNQYDSFDTNTYRYMNNDLDKLFGANRQRLKDHYVAAGISDGRAIAPSWDIKPFSGGPRKINRRIMADGLLTDGEGMCPMRDCSDPQVLQELMDSYNNDPKRPGMMLRIFKATTLGENQCDVEAEIDYDANKEYIPPPKSASAPAPGPSSRRPAPAPGSRAPAPAPGTREPFQNAAAPAPAPGSRSNDIRKVQMSIIPDIDTNVCKYKVADIKNINSIFTIQENTPALPSPVDYGTYVYKQSKEGNPSDPFTFPGVDSNFKSLKKVGSETFEQVKAALKKYRVESNTTSGELSTLDLEGCPNIKCNDEPVILKFLRQAGNSFPPSRYIAKILKAVALTDPSGTINCEYTVTEERYGYDQENLPGPRMLDFQTKAYRAEVAKPVAGSCAVRFKSVKSVLPTMTPDWEQIKDIQELITLQKYAKFSDVMTNYDNMMPKRFISFTGKKARAIFRDTLQMGQLIERRAIDISTVYVRYYPRTQDNQILTNRPPLQSIVSFKVNSDFTAVLDRERKVDGSPGPPPRSFKVGIENQILTEQIQFTYDEKRTRTISGSIGTFDCAKVTRAFGIPFTAAIPIKDTADNNICELRLTDDISKPIEDNYLKVMFYTEDNNDLALNTLVDVTSQNSLMAAIPESINHWKWIGYNDPQMRDTARFNLMKVTRDDGLVRKMFREQFSKADSNPRRVFGRFYGGRVDAEGGAYIYAISMAEFDANNTMVGFYDNGQFSKPAFLRCEMRRQLTGTRESYILSMRFVEDEYSNNYVPFEDPRPNGNLGDPISSIKQYKFIRFVPTLARRQASKFVELLRMQFFNGTAPLSLAPVKVNVIPLLPGLEVPKENPTFLFSTDPTMITRPEEAISYKLPINVSLVINTVDPIQPDGFSFMTGGNPDNDCVQWRIQGSLNAVWWKDLSVQTTNYSYSDFGYWRLPIIPFNPAARPISLPQNGNRPRGLREMKVEPTDFRVLQDAARLVYERLSSIRNPDYSASEPMTGRCFLRNIASFAFLPLSNQVLLKVRYDMISKEYRITTVDIPDVVLVLTYHLKRVSDPVPDVVLNSARTGINTSSSALNFAGFRPYPNEPTKRSSVDVFPYGWGGIQSPMINFESQGPMRFISNEVGKAVPNLLSIPKYSLPTPTGILSRDFGKSSYTGLTREGAALICNGSPDCIGFFENADGNSGVFYGMPTSTSILQNTQEVLKQEPSRTGQPTILRFNHMYLKKGTILFRFARLTQMQPRDPASPIIQLGKIGFYRAGKRVEGNLLNGRMIPAATPTPDSLPSNLFNYRESTKGWRASRGMGLEFEFRTPMTAEGIVFATAAREPVASDVASFVLEISLTGQTWRRIMQRTFSPPTMRQRATPMFMFNPDRQDGATNDFDPKTMDTCRVGCADPNTLNVLTTKFYNENTESTFDNKTPEKNPLNVTRIGFNQPMSECVLEYDKSEGGSGSVGFQFAPTYESCDLITNPDNIQINLRPDPSKIQMNRIEPSGLEQFRYVRLRTLSTIGDRPSLQLGKIILFDGDGRAVKAGAAEAITQAVSLPPTTNPSAAEAINYGDLESSWDEPRLATLLLYIDPKKVKYPLTAFTMITGLDGSRGPKTWFLEASEDSRFWKILHSTETHPRGQGPPAGNRAQYLQYPFDRQKQPIQIQNVLMKKLDDFQQSCTSPEIMDLVANALSIRTEPILFDPVGFRYDRTTNRCDYVQRDGRTITATFQTAFAKQQDIRNQSRLTNVQIPSPNPLGGPQEVSPEMKGIGECEVKPACDTETALTRFNEELNKKYPGTPISARSRGLDFNRNACVFELDDAYPVPKNIGFQFQKRAACTNAEPQLLKLDDKIPDSYQNTNMRQPTQRGPFRFIRFRVTKTYDPKADALAVGGLLFFRIQNNAATALSIPTGTKITNPMGSASPIDTSMLRTGWVDPSKKPIVLQFTNPFAFDGYTWRTASNTLIDGIQTARGTLSFRNDPVQWKLEGSTNGTFWTVIHEQTTDYIPTEPTRGANNVITAAPVLRRSIAVQVFPIRNPTAQFRAPTSMHEPPPVQTFSLLDGGFTCSNPAVWNAVTTAYNNSALTGTNKNTLLRTPPVGNAARNDFRFIYNARSNTCTYQIRNTVRITQTTSRIDTVLRYLTVTFPRFTTRPTSTATLPQINIQLSQSTTPPGGTLPNQPMF